MIDHHRHSPARYGTSTVPVPAGAHEEPRLPAQEHAWEPLAQDAGGDLLRLLAYVVRYRRLLVMLMAAGLRCIRAATEVGGTLMFIDAKDERVAKWYRSYGALSLDDRPLSLFQPLASFEAGLRLGGKL